MRGAAVPQAQRRLSFQRELWSGCRVAEKGELAQQWPGVDSGGQWLPLVAL